QRYSKRGKSEVTPADRAGRFGQKPATLLLTGLVGSGKSTIARALEKKLFDAGRAVHVLDGGNAALASDVDPEFSADRSTGLLQIAETARLLNDAGLVAVLAFSSPAAADRAKIRDIVGKDRAVEIFLSAPMGVCRRRDPAGLYGRADSGQLKHFPGVSDFYEPPASPDLALPTHELSVDACVDRIIDLLKMRGIIN
ncbi:MAG TPA: adenylyl-sulfate kinase, partial [Planctomycetota bacterium]|nr:adenylyl-sulfate kinase [Planctomycetota bacterium]